MAMRVNLLWIAICCTFIILIEGVPLHHYKHHHFHATHRYAENPQSRSYIDIDASDPFKVPKSSHYIDQPVPEFSHQSDENDQHNDEADEEHAPDTNPDDGPDESPENGPDNSPPENNPAKSFDNIQDDLKQMGLEKYTNTNNNNNNDDINNKSIDSQDGQPIIEQDNSNADPNKPIEIGDVDQSLKNLGDSNSRHNVPVGDNDDEQKDDEGEDRNEQN